VVEIIFSKPELIALCEQSGLRLERTWPCIPYDVFDVTGHHSTTETYLFARDNRRNRKHCLKNDPLPD
jgi:hypothetical protein